MKLIRKLQAGDWEPIVAFVVGAIILGLLALAVSVVLNGPNLSPAG